MVKTFSILSSDSKVHSKMILAGCDAFVPNVKQSKPHGINVSDGLVQLAELNNEIPKFELDLRINDAIEPQMLNISMTIKIF
jgi:hypothetical protein